MGEGFLVHTVAIIFIPPGHPLDGLLVLACIQHVLRRGYHLSAILRDWEVVAAHLAIGAAQVVVLATRTHRAGEVDRAEYVDEEQTRVLRRRNAAVGRHCVPGALQPPNALPRVSLGPTLGEIAAYQTGYAEGYVDCATVKSTMPWPPGRG